MIVKCKGPRIWELGATQTAVRRRITPARWTGRTLSDSDTCVINRLYAALAWSAIGLGLLHIAATPRYSRELTQAALWFASGGLLMILTGVLNLLNRTYGTAAPGVRWAATVTSAVTTAFGALAGALGRPTLLEFAVVLSIFGGCTLCSGVRAARLPRVAV